jgi:hypothetical protein
VTISPPIQPITGHDISDSCVTGAIYEVAEGTTVTLTAAPGTNSVFDHWEGGATGTANPVNVVVNGNTAVRAVFVPRFTVTVTVEGSGSVDPNGGTFDGGFA